MIPKFRAWDSVEKKFVEHFFITNIGLQTSYSYRKVRIDPHAINRPQRQERQGNL